MAEKLIMAKTPAEAVSLKIADAAFLAGGTEVNRLGTPVETGTLISLKKCDGLSGIEAENGYVTIGSMCTFQQVIESDTVPGYLREAAHFMASRTKRNMATIGGNIAAGRDDSYLISTLRAAGAVLDLMEDGCRTFSTDIEEYLNGEYESALIYSVTVPGGINVVSKRYANTAQSHAVLTMSAAMGAEGIRLYGAVKNCGLLHFCDLEKAFRENPDISEEEIIEMVKVCTGLNTADDMFGSDAYKRYLIAVTAFDLHRHLAGREAQS